MRSDQFSFFRRLWGWWLHFPSRRQANERRDSELFSDWAHVEMVEERTLLSGVSAAEVVGEFYAQPAYALTDPALPNTTTTPNPTGLSPSKIETAYGFSKVANNGAGQTIAIVDAYDDPTIQSDLKSFDKTYGLPDPSLQVVSQTGATSNLPSTDPATQWEVEESLDVEWAHALAPGASIVLVEANSAGYSDLISGVQTAEDLPGVSVVSMSWGGPQFSVEAFYDSYFTTPGGHQGVTFVASTGDSGAPGEFPASSSNVLAVGGTTLTVDSQGNYVSESGWSGSGGGVSAYESQPSYQSGFVTQSTTMRTIPDVSFDANPMSGVAIYDSFNYGTTNPWTQVGGTSFSAPAWGAIVAIVNQGRAQSGLGTLNGATQTLPMLYQLDKSNSGAFHDITTGNNGNAAGLGYDLVTGLGSPVVNQIYSGLGAVPSASMLAIQQSPASGTAGMTLGTLTVAVENQSGQIVAADNSTVTLSIGNGPGSFAAGSTVSVQAVNGVATFTNLRLNTAGSYTIVASDGILTSASLPAIKINAGQSSQVSFQQVPGTGTAGSALQPVSVLVEDQFGNLVTTDNSTVTISVSTGSGPFAPGSTVSVAAVGGISTFTNLMLDVAGSYSLNASDGSLNNGMSSAISISPAQAAKVVFLQVPMSGIATNTLQSIVAGVEDQFGNLVTTNNSTVTISVASGVGAFSSDSTTSVAAVNGIATFSNLVLGLAGNYTLLASDGNLASATSSAMTINPTQAAILAFQQSPTAAVAGSALQAVTVAVEDKFGNVLAGDTSTVMLMLNTGTFASGATTISAKAVNGIATFSGLTITKAGSIKLLATDWALAQVSSPSIVITPAAASQLVFTQVPPTTVSAGAMFSPFVKVTVEDQYGNIVTSDTSTVTLALNAGTFSTGSSSITATASNGVASFYLAINQAGTYSLTASDGALSGATSGNINVAPLTTAAKLVFQQIPSSGIAGNALQTIAVAVEDKYGNIVTGVNSSVTLSLSSGAFANGSTTATVATVNGIATFSGLAINKTGSYKLTASDGAVTQVAPTSTVISSAAANQVVFLQGPPTSATAGVAFNPLVRVAVEDQYGNIVTSDSSSITLSLSSGTFSTGVGLATIAATNGTASFYLAINNAGTYRLIASDGVLAGTTSGTVIVTPAAAAKVVFQQVPATGTAGAGLQTVIIAVEDKFGNVVTIDSSSVTLTLSSGTFADGSTTETVSAVKGVATFSNLMINKSGTYKLTAGDGTLTAAVSGNLVINASG